MILLDFRPNWVFQSGSMKVQIRSGLRKIHHFTFDPQQFQNTLSHVWRNDHQVSMGIGSNSRYMFGLCC